MEKGAKEQGVCSERVLLHMAGSRTCGMSMTWSLNKICIMTNSLGILTWMGRTSQDFWWGQAVHGFLENFFSRNKAPVYTISSKHIHLEAILNGWLSFIYRVWSRGRWYGHDINTVSSHEWGYQNKINVKNVIKGINNQCEPEERSMILRLQGNWNYSVW